MSCQQVPLLCGAEVSLQNVDLSLCWCAIKSDFRAKKVPATAQTFSDGAAKSCILGLLNQQTLLIASNHSLQHCKRRKDFLQVKEQHKLLQK